MRDFVKLINEEKYKIIGALIGLIISIVSIILYSYYDNLVWLDIILSIICLFYAVFQSYILYFKSKEWDIISKIILSILFFIVYTAIVFTVITVFSMLVLKFPFSLNYFMYAIFVTPAFLIVILILILLLSVLQYA